MLLRKLVRLLSMGLGRKGIGLWNYGQIYNLLWPTLYFRLTL